jgi:putative transposase
MPRAIRQGTESGLYHVGTRGNNQRGIYLNDGDHLAFLNLLAKTVEKSSWKLHAYCLMGNHYHLLLETELDDLSSGMQLLNSGYATTFNKRHRRTGHLFGNRFWSESIERDEHLLECCRYIAWNPVRAGLCKRPEDWQWASYPAVLGIDPPPPFLATEPMLLQFGADRARAVQRFRAFVDRR